jgi:hypothetical protein
MTEEIMAYTACILHVRVIWNSCSVNTPHPNTVIQFHVFPEHFSSLHVFILSTLGNLMFLDMEITMFTISFHPRPCKKAVSVY